MTAAYEDDWVVRVRAQVMCRDEGTGGWTALGGGGLANVMVGKRNTSETAGTESTEENGKPRPPHHNHEYFIHGVRISDETEVLSCTIKKDFQYNKVMPTFHHWVTDEKRFGLTFQTAADARAFDRGVRAAVEELLDGLGGAWPSLYSYKHHNLVPREDDDEHIFECLNLPSESRSSSENSTASRPKGDIQTPILSAITLPRQSSPRNNDTSLKQFRMSGDDDKLTVEETNSDQCPYVHLTAVHEYTYPQVSSEKSSPNTKPPLLKRDSGSIKLSYTEPPPLPDKKITKTSAQFQARLKCRHCNEWYVQSTNRIGSCEYAPDRFKTCVDTVSCLQCAQLVWPHITKSISPLPLLLPTPSMCSPNSESGQNSWMCPFASVRIASLTDTLTICICGPHPRCQLIEDSGVCFYPKLGDSVLFNEVSKRTMKSEFSESNKCIAWNYDENLIYFS